MSASEAMHPTLNDLKFEIGQVLVCWSFLGQVLVCWSFLENTMREHLKRAGLQEQILKGPVISHWRTYIKATYPDRAHELLEPVEKVARVRNFLAHSIYSLHADPWTKGSAVIACAAPDGILHSFSIDDLRAACTELSELVVKPIRLFVADTKLLMTAVGAFLQLPALSGPLALATNRASCLVVGKARPKPPPSFRGSIAHVG